MLLFEQAARNGRRLADFAESTEHEMERQIGGGKGRPSPRKIVGLRITERKGEIREILTAAMPSGCEKSKYLWRLAESRRRDPMMP